MTAPAFSEAAAIEASLDLLAERGVDPARRTYEILFARFPGMEAHFWRDTDGSVRGAMLSRCFEAILDFIGERRYAGHMIRNEMITHEGYDIPRDHFATFFGVIRDALSDLLGSEWSPRFSAAWDHLLAEMAGYMGTVPMVAESNPVFKAMTADFEARWLERSAG